VGRPVEKGKAKKPTRGKNDKILQKGKNKFHGERKRHKKRPATHLCAGRLIRWVEKTGAGRNFMKAPPPGKSQVWGREFCWERGAAHQMELC